MRDVIRGTRADVVPASAMRTAGKLARTVHAAVNLTRAVRAAFALVRTERAAFAFARAAHAVLVIAVLLYPLTTWAAEPPERAPAEFVVVTAGVADVTAHRPRSWGVLDFLPFGQIPAATLDTAARSVDRSAADGARSVLAEGDVAGRRLAELLVQALVARGRTAEFVAVVRTSAGAELALRRDQIPEELRGRWLVDASVPRLGLRKHSGAYEPTGAFAYRVLNVRGQLLTLPRSFQVVPAAECDEAAQAICFTPAGGCRFETEATLRANSHALGGCMDALFEAAALRIARDLAERRLE